MTLDVRINGQSLRDILTSPPQIDDDMHAVCRTLSISVYAADGLINYLGQPIELWYRSECWYFGFIFARDFDANGNINYTANDPLFWFRKNIDDYYYKNMTATQIIKALAAKTAVKVHKLANTGVVFTKPLYYQASQPDKIAIDVLARTYMASNKKKYWYRYEGNLGLHLFERVVPKTIWAFQVGINLTSASYKESIEETCTVVKLVNRETGKVVVKANTTAMKKFGHMQHFEEIDKEGAPGMEAKATELLRKLSQVKVTSNFAGINPNRVMPQLYSGDVIYVEEEFTGLIGAYHIINVSQTFVDDDLVTMAFEVQEAPDVPVMEYPDATTNPAEKAKESKPKGKEKKKKDTKEKATPKKGAKKGKKPKDAGEGASSGPYSDELKKVITKYGL